MTEGIILLLIGFYLIVGLVYICNSRTNAWGDLKPDNELGELMLAILRMPIILIILSIPIGLIIAGIVALF